MAHSTRPPPLDLPPLDGLATLLAVARGGSFSAAADALGLTHGAVSRRVAAVERWLGMALFERHGRGVRATPDGQRYLGRVEEAFGLLSQASGDRWARRRGTEVVTLSVVPAFAKLWLFEHLDRLQGMGERRPVRIEIAVEHRHADVEGGAVDLAVRYGRGSWRGLDAASMAQERLVPIAARAIAARLGPDPAPAAILSLPLLHDSDPTGWRTWSAAAGAPLARPKPADRRLEDYTLVLAAAEAGLGVALARSPLSDRYLAGSGGALVRLHDLMVEAPLNHYVVTRPREARPAVLHVRAKLLGGMT